MKLLLDTHIWLWAAAAPDRLGPRTKLSLTDGRNEIWLSPISIWELALLVERGRFAVTCSVADWVERAYKKMGWREAPLTTAVALEVARHALVRRDPADRFLVATAKVNELTLVTADATILASRACRLLANE
ncbi:MAG: type II toxin-antitoxin system VapC family toxin [Terriglobales bacterium]